MISHTHTEPAQRRGMLVELAVCTVAALSLAAGTDFPDQMPLQHSATLLLSGYLLFQILTRRVRPLDLRCLLGFMLLHAFAARWIYSYVPYDRWTESLFGFSATRTFHFRRNHFDRLVHFLYGVLVSPHVLRKLSRHAAARGATRYFTVEFVAASSLFYELFEWGLTAVLSPDDVESYNGQQGDPWDAHKDMLAAILGSVAVVVPVHVLDRMKPRRFKSSAPNS